jgi:hypothetical protein
LGGSLRTTDLVSTITIIVLDPFRCIIDIGSRDGWGQGVNNRWWSGFGISGVLLAHLLFFNRVVEDDDIAITERPKKPTVEVIEELLSKHLIPQSDGKASSSSKERSTTGISSLGLPCSYIGDGGRREETSGGDTGGGRDPDEEGGGVDTLLGKDEEPLVEERESLVPLLSFITNKWRRKEKPLEKKWEVLDE